MLIESRLSIVESSLGRSSMLIVSRLSMVESSLGRSSSESMLIRSRNINLGRGRNRLKWWSVNELVTESGEE